MICPLVRLMLFCFTPVRFIGLTRFAFPGEAFLALLLADILKGFVSGAFPRFRAACANRREQRREQHGQERCYGWFSLHGIKTRGVSQTPEITGKAHRTRCVAVAYAVIGGYG